MNLATERAAIKALLGTIAGLQVYETVPARINTPCAIVDVKPFEPHACLDAGSMDAEFTIQVLVQWTDWESAQAALDAYLTTGTATSVIDAIQAGGAAYVVDKMDSYGTVKLDGGETTYGSATVQVTVLI